MTEIDVDVLWQKIVTERVLDSLRKSNVIIIDPDQLFSGGALSVFAQHQIRVIRVIDSLSLRYEYETSIRGDEVESNKTFLFLIEFPKSEVPYDIQMQTEYLEFSLDEFFDKLSIRVVRELPHDWRPVIYSYQRSLLQERQALTDHNTARFIAKTCLSIDMPEYTTWESVLGLLADLVLYDLELPDILQEHLLPKEMKEQINEISALLTSNTQAAGFLREVWDEYIVKVTSENREIADSASNMVDQAVNTIGSSLTLQSKFTALIADNRISSAVIQEPEKLPSWLRPKIHFHEDMDYVLMEELSYLQNHLPKKNVGFNEWSSFAVHWARWNVEYYQLSHPSGDLSQRRFDLQSEMIDNFSAWLYENYTILLQDVYLPTPKCVNRVLSQIKMRYNPTIDCPVAIVVVDGMSLEDWNIIRTSWENQLNKCDFQEHQMLALVPTITSVSRQTLLSGKLPQQYPKHWLTTQHEEKMWRMYWEDQGLHQGTIKYLRGLGLQKSTPGNIEAKVLNVLSQPHLSVAVFIINTIDKMVHGNVLGTRALQTLIREWVEEDQYMFHLVSRLLGRFEIIVITSDHGHIQGKGIGRPSGGVLAEERALRAQIFLKFEGTMIEGDSVMKWHTVGLPKGADVYLPRGLGMFALQGNQEVSHGGVSIEEAFVPYVTISGKKDESYRTANDRV